MYDIEITVPAAQYCLDAVNDSCKELQNTAREMEGGLSLLMRICEGEKFKKIKEDVSKRLAALNEQINLLHSRTKPKLEEILAWAIIVSQR